MLFHGWRFPRADVKWKLGDRRLSFISSKDLPPPFSSAVNVKDLFQFLMPIVMHKWWSIVVQLEDNF